MNLFDRFVHKYSRLPTETDPDYLEMLRMSKYRVLAVPDVSPGKCANCGSSKNDGRKYIDFQLHVEWYGAVFLCGDCLKDIAKAMGLFNKLNKELEELVNSRNTRDGLQEEGINLHERLVVLFKDFEEYYAGLHSISNDSGSDSGSDVGNDETPTVEPRTNAAKSRTTKSTTESGPKDIRSLADLLNDSN